MVDGEHIPKRKRKHLLGDTDEENEDENEDVFTALVCDGNNANEERQIDG